MNDSAADASVRIENVTFGYGSAPTVENINIHVDRGEMVALLGGNGAGKSTILKLISGFITPWSGSIYTFGTELKRRERPHLRARRGLRLVLQGHPVFNSLTVAENLKLYEDLRGTVKNDDVTQLSVDEVIGLFPRLGERAKVAAGSLSGGERAMLATAAPLVAGASILLLDEPSAGLAPSAMADFFADLKRLSETTGITMLIVEQNAYAVLPLCDRAYAMSEGRIVLDATPEELMADEQLVTSYLAY